MGKVTKKSQADLFPQMDNSSAAGKFLQVELFQNADTGLANYQALYDLAPRYVARVERKEGSAYLNGLKREFSFNGEDYRVSVSPARITDGSGNERDELPGEREQLVEDVIRRFASENMKVSDSDQVRVPFTIYRIQQELSRHKHSFSWSEIKEALFILNKSTIEITRLVAAGEKKPKPVVSASAFPVLALKDETDSYSGAFVDLNPLLVQSIKSLDFRQLNYDVMMQFKRSLPRWIFKYVSLLLTNRDDDRFLELRTTDMARSNGSQRARWRDTLADFEKAIANLHEEGVLASYTRKDVFNGKRKVDSVFTLEFSRSFREDRMRARSTAKHIRDESIRYTGSASPSKFHVISGAEVHRIKERTLEAQAQLKLVDLGAN